MRPRLPILILTATLCSVADASELLDVDDASRITPVAGASDLLDVYRMALDYDATYVSARYQRQIAALDPVVAESALKPQVNAAASIDLQREDVSGAASDTLDSERAVISLDQVLYDKQSRIGVDQARLGDDQSAIDLEFAEDDVVIRAATQYFIVLGAIDNLELATGEKIAIQRQLELADERLNVGIGTQTDLYDAQARFQIAEANEIEAGNLIAEAVQALIEIVGSDPGMLARLRDDAPLEPPSPNDIDAWIAAALDNNPVLRSGAVGLEIARREVDRQQARKHPSVALGLSQSFATGESASGFTSGSRSNTAIGVQVSMPLYLGGAVRAQVQQAGLGANIEEQSLELSRRQTTRAVRDLFNNVTSGINRVQALRQAVVASESAVEAKEEGYAAGLITNLDVLDAQRDLYQARRDYLRARYDYILSILSLEQVAGQLNQDDVARINEWLEFPG